MSLKHWLLSGLIVILRCTCHLPYRLQMRLGRYLGLLYFFFPTRMRQNTFINLTLCYPQKSPDEIKSLARHVFISLGIGIFETALAWWGNVEKLRTLAHFTGLEHLQNAFQQKIPTIILGAHFTHIELLGRFTSLLTPVAAMYYPPKDAFLADILKKNLGQLYTKLIERHQIKKLIQTVKAGIPVWYAVDLDPGKQQMIFSDFFGVQTATSTALPKLARITGAQIVSITAHRRDDHSGYDISISPLTANFPTADLSQDVAYINEIIMSLIQPHPAQYMWQYKRFKTRPPGYPKIYP